MEDYCALRLLSPQGDLQPALRNSASTVGHEALFLSAGYETPSAKNAVKKTFGLAQNLEVYCV